MPNSPRMQWPYPAQYADPWYDAYVAQIDSQDSSVYASREDRNIILMDGGTFAFSAVTGILSWSAPIRILSATTGFALNILAGNVTLRDGDVFYTNLVRAPTNNATVPALVAQKVPSTDEALIIAIRRGTQLYLRDGMVMQDGQSGQILILGGLFGGGGGGGLAILPSPAVNAGDMSIVGSSVLAARQDHQHAVNTALVGDINSVDASTTFAGVSPRLPRADHKHLVSTAAPVATGTANAAGVAPTLTRSDHVHRTLVALQQGGVAVASRPTINFVGAVVSDDVMADRINVQIPNYTAGTPVATGAANVRGTGPGFCYEDHVHRTLVGVRQTGAIVGYRPNLNIFGTVSISDNAGTDAVDISISGGVPAGQKIKSDVALNSFVVINSPTFVRTGAFNFNTADYAISGTALSMRFVATLSVSRIGLNADIRFLDDVGAVIATLSSLSLTPTNFVTPDFTLPPKDNLIRVEFRCNGAGIGDFATIWYAGIQIDRTF